MALHQSAWALGQLQLPVSAESRGTVTERFNFIVNEDIADGDIIELAGLPAYHFPVNAVLITPALGAGVTADLGIMSGKFGEADDARTSGDELYDGVDVAAAAVTRMTLASGFLIAQANDHRGIGLKILGDDVAAAGQEITLILSYVQ